MKKYAIQLSGQPRYRTKAIQSLITNVISQNDCDVFGHFWEYENFIPQFAAISDVANYRDKLDYESFSGQLKSIIESIPFTEVLTESQIQFDVEKFHPGDEKERVIREIGFDKASAHFKRCNFIMQSQWYSIMKTSELRQNYELKNNFKYEGVLKFRPDVFVPNKIQFEQYDNAKLSLPYYNEGIVNENDILICTDIIAFGSSEMVTKFCGFYNHFDDILSMPDIDALLGNPLAQYLRKYIENKNIIPNHFNFNCRIVENIIRTL